MRILLTGRNGQVGAELVGALAPLGELEATGRAELDLCDADAIVAAVRSFRPSLIVNAAAWTDVDGAEARPGRALAVNARAPRVLAEEAARLGAGLVHYSTDYVFDGRKPEPYVEDDRPAPVNAYGRTKLLGEEAVRGSGAPHLILRVGWVYGLRRRNFLTSMMELFSSRERVEVVDDQHGAPTWCREIARATGKLIERLLGSGRAATGTAGGKAVVRGLAERGGTFHLGTPGETTWYGFAAEIARLLRETEGPGIRLERLEPIPSERWPAAATRPRNSRLDDRRLRERFGVALPPWEEQLAACLASRPVAREVLLG